MNASLTNRVSARAALHVRVGEDVNANLARARTAMMSLQQGRRPKPHFAIGFAEVGQMLAVFTPKRWQLIAKLREIGPVTIARLARTLERDYRNVHADVVALSEWLAVQRDEEGLVSVPWAEIVVDMKLPAQWAA
jgi:predicted transcriptional regulator